MVFLCVVGFVFLYCWLFVLLAFCTVSFLYCWLFLRCTVGVRCQRIYFREAMLMPSLLHESLIKDCAMPSLHIAL